MKICAVYKIINTATGDFYIGSSKDVKQRLAVHKCQSVWKKYPNKQLYQDMRKYSLENFEFEIIAEVEAASLKEKEQQFIETLKPTYNNINAKGLNVERRRKYQKEYQKANKYKEYQKKYQKEYNKEYHKSDKYKESQKKANNKYQNQLCFYNDEVLTLSALSKRFSRAGIEHPQIEAKKYLLNK